VGKGCLVVTVLTLSFSFQHYVLWIWNYGDPNKKKKACHKITIINVIGCVMCSIILLSFHRARHLSGTYRDRCSTRCSDKRNGLSFCFAVIVMGTANWSILVIPLTNISAGVMVIPVLTCLIKEENRYSVWWWY